MDPIGIIIGGNFNSILVRLKHDAEVELGDIVVVKVENNMKTKTYLLEVYDLVYSSQVSQQKLELISGFNLETSENAMLFDKKLRLYKLAVAKPLVIIKENEVKQAKDMPHLFSEVYKLKKDDFKLICNDDENNVMIGNLRGTDDDVKVYVDYRKMLTHHVLIPAQTGKGKSNLVKVLLWNLLHKNDVAFFVIDPHNEYFLGNYDSKNMGLKDHPLSEKVFYYSSSIKNKMHKNMLSLNIPIFSLKPEHFFGVIGFSESQVQAISRLYREFKERWIVKMFHLSEQEKEELGIHDSTYIALKRKFAYALNLDNQGNPKGLFTFDTLDTVADIVNKLESGKSVIIDTSTLSDVQELLVSSIIINKLFQRYVNYKNNQQLNSKPIVSIVIEEAPRVLGKDKVEQGNIFSTIAREGRKFKIGLIAITQLPSFIPREIIANMNTKIILGLEMAPERHIIVESSAQDLKELEKSIASLDKGEAIISSTFVRFAMPIKIPLFHEYAIKDLKNQPETPKRDAAFNPFDEV